jgi:hypothetical protein
MGGGHSVRPLAASGVALLCCALVAGCSEGAAPPTAPETSASGGTASTPAVTADQVEPWRAGPVPGSDATGPTYPTTWPTSTVVGSGPTTG